MLNILTCVRVAPATADVHIIAPAEFLAPEGQKPEEAP